jgi:hypothetical protein
VKAKAGTMRKSWSQSWINTFRILTSQVVIPLAWNYLWVCTAVQVKQSKMICLHLHVDKYILETLDEYFGYVATKSGSQKRVPLLQGRQPYPSGCQCNEARSASSPAGPAAMPRPPHGLPPPCQQGWPPSFETTLLTMWEGPRFLYSAAIRDASAR